MSGLDGTRQHQVKDSNRPGSGQFAPTPPKEKQTDKHERATAAAKTICGRQATKTRSYRSAGLEVGPSRGARLRKAGKEMLQIAGAEARKKGDKIGISLSEISYRVISKLLLN